MHKFAWRRRHRLLHTAWNGLLTSTCRWRGADGLNGLPDTTGVRVASKSLPRPALQLSLFSLPLEHSLLVSDRLSHNGPPHHRLPRAHVARRERTEPRGPRALRSQFDHHLHAGGPYISQHARRTDPISFYA